jgi:hypothetical protein
MENKMNDSINAASAAPKDAPVTNEDFLQKVEDEFSELEQDAVNEFEKIKALFSADVWPYVKAGFLTLLTISGKAAMQAEVAAIPLELTGNVASAAAAVGAAISGAVAANAEAVAITEGKQALAAINADPNATDGEKALAAEGEKLIPQDQTTGTGAANGST